MIHSLRPPETDKVIALNQLKGYISEQQRFRLYDILKAPGMEIEMLMTDYDAWNEAERAVGKDLARTDFQKPCRVISRLPSPPQYTWKYHFPKYH